MRQIERLDRAERPGLHALELAVARRDRAVADVELAVAAARAEGRSWSAIGDVLGISRQSAYERFSS